MRTFDAGNMLNQGAYKSFQPSMIHRQWHLEDMELITLLSEADQHLGRLDMYSHYIPNIDLFIRMHVFKEATQSSKIEGTRTNIKEALLAVDEIPDEKRNDWEEVQNYIAALDAAIANLETLPFSSRLIKDTHAILMRGVRGKHKQPGDFRKSQNWIGGANIDKAIFVPPVHTSIAEYMGDLEKFAHDEAFYFPTLLKTALMHYQFETIHPFLDGNGRVGRLMITLYLVERGILKKPVLYLSDYFERNRSAYYDHLTLVREKNSLLQWFKFFLRGVIETARLSTANMDAILKLQVEVTEKLNSLGSRAANAQLLVNYLFQRPLIDYQKAMEVTNLTASSVNRLLSAMEELEIITEFTGAKRGKRYLFADYLGLFESI